MCGIAGQVSFSEDLLNLKPYFYNMSQKLRNRGPDQQGEFFSHEAVLVHRRLSVIDPEKGAQPMEYELEGEKYIIAYDSQNRSRRNCFFMPDFVNFFLKLK